MPVKRTTKATTRRTQPKRRKQTKQLNPRSAMPKVPKSVKNAYDLLGFVQQVIREEPRRYNQGDWLDRHTPERPACGTVGCVAGWIATLTSPAGAVLSVFDVILRADKVLGKWVPIEELYDGAACALTAPQTPEHAEAGIAHIEAFRQKYKTQLQGQPV